MKYKLLLILSILLIAGCSNKDINQLKEENEKLKDENITLSERIINVTEENNSLKEELENEDLGELECQFIRTYIVKDFLEYTTDEKDKEEFIVLDQFQENDPFLIKLNNSYNLEKNKFYEFTFKGSTKHRKSEQKFLFKNYTLASVELTDKLGLEQIQESCR